MTSRGLGMFMTPSFGLAAYPAGDSLETRLDGSHPDHPQVIHVVAIDLIPADCSPSRRVLYLPRSVPAR